MSFEFRLRQTPKAWTNKNSSLLPERIIACIAGTASLSALLTLPALAQESTGTSFGIPNSSPGVFWPRFMSIEALSPSFLYPNGSNFGLSNSSGGFGMAGSGALSGVGLERRGLSSLIAEELARPYLYQRRLGEMFKQESLLSSSIFAAALSAKFSRQMRTPSMGQDLSGQILGPELLPAVDNVLRDLPYSTDYILQTTLP